MTGVRVTNVAPAVDDEELRSWLEGIGPLVYFDRQPGGTVIVEYSRPAQARKAAIALNNRGLGGFPIHTEVVPGPLREELHTAPLAEAPQPPFKRPRISPSVPYAVSDGAFRLQAAAPPHSPSWGAAVSPIPSAVHRSPYPRIEPFMPLEDPSACLPAPTQWDGSQPFPAPDSSWEGALPPHPVPPAVGRGAGVRGVPQRQRIPSCWPGLHPPNRRGLHFGGPSNRLGWQSGLATPSPSVAAVPHGPPALSSALQTPFATPAPQPFRILPVPNPPNLAVLV
eukprot:GGOE01036943.1.p1 GENE.GGOE01036943.1~~GGOE01036943.1.p1  ORF type:complete len:306 (+),score=23.56 GGOE01036943.1:78-920(+)